ncbi:GIY-YIG nuclease family protein [Fulvivirga sedimenti]|uniref:GIY-YIG nuclease family protein n=1 Tax=Fulvivirga sedimenti TaxID=2879465 RepID=A0A9X1KUG5_9BACT|nr:GIY-YIG nuclease family protein [Fulvivirga sedimenti]MCA6073473.1 GIY-YIG nuclease family protein [Fulvivirga sedimenti]
MYVYVLQSLKDRRHYVGITKDIDKRVNEHNSGRTRSTKPYRPWVLIRVEQYPTRIEARNREKYLKSGCGKELIKRYWSRSSTG